MKRYFLDTEFIEDGVTIDLISIALVCDDGREYYAISNEFNSSKAHQWVKDNVIAKLPPRPCFTQNPYASASDKEASKIWKTREQIKEDVLFFLAGGVFHSDGSQTLYWDESVKDVEFWADYAAYDWVVFCQLFGNMLDLPRELPMFCSDIQQWKTQLGKPELPEQALGHHNALEDARHCKVRYEFLKAYEERLRS